MIRKEVLPKTHGPVAGLGRRIFRLSFIVVGMMFFYSCSSPQEGSTIVSGKARFEFLTASLVRMEHAPSGQFVDASTVVVQQRSWPKVAVQTTNKNGWLTMQTTRLKVRYRLHSGSFTKGNLSVAWRDSMGSHLWHPTEKDSLNLGGIRYSLDGVRKGYLPKVQPGLLSRSGYFLLDDSHSPVWDSTKTWIVPRPDTNGQDWYFFTYGRNYKKVLSEFARLSGRIPMIPRYVLGAWMTDLNFEYFPGTKEVKEKIFKQYNETHLKKEILQFRHYGIPLDILVMDFGWHNYGWQGGYDWSPLIPHPDKFLTWLHAHGIKVSLNDHPGYSFAKGESVLSYQDSRTPEVLKELGRSMPVKPSFKIDLSKDWKFAAGLKEAGVRLKWFSKGFNDSRWKILQAGISGNSLDFLKNKEQAWFRKTIKLPKTLPDSLFIVLGRMRKQYGLYVNGRKVAHTTPRWFRFHTYANIIPYVKAGENNVIALRIPYQRGGGSTRLSVAIQNVPPPEPIYFNLAVKKQANVFMSVLHGPLMKAGVNFWWIDGGMGAAKMSGLNNQLWTNRVYYDYTQQLTHKRGFVFGRYGGWGNQRYPAFFTGDTYSQWPVLAYEVQFTTQGGNVLMPYITHDIGGYHGKNIPFDLYARWVEFGAFSPILRLHSAHENPKEGNLRMPWTYGKKGIVLDRKFFSLRYKLLPYIYTYVRQAYDSALPLLRPLYLEYPKLSEAYKHPHEYFFGKEILVAPVVDSTGMRTIYLPPGEWDDFFTGKSYKGAQTFTAHYNVDEMPVFVRAGSVIPEQTPMAYSNQRPLDTLIVRVYGSKPGSFNLYEDDGISLNYKKGQFARTPIRFSKKKGGSTYQLTIGPTLGRYAGQVKERAYIVRIQGIQKPQSVDINHQPVVKNAGSGTGWFWDARRSLVTINVPLKSIRDTVQVELH